MRAIFTGMMMAGALMLAGCSDSPVNNNRLMVESGYVNLPASPDRPAAGYFTVRGGPAAVDLLDVTSTMALRTELHESVREGEMMTMRKVTAVPVPAGGRLEAKPGGVHVMIWGINDAAAQAGRLPMIFLFSNNDRIAFDLEVRNPGPAAAAGGAAKMDKPKDGDHQGDEGHEGH